MEPSNDANQNNPFEDPSLLAPSNDSEGYTEEWPESGDDTIPKSDNSDDVKADDLSIVTTPQPATKTTAPVINTPGTPGTPPPEKPSRSGSLIKSRLKTLTELQNPDADNRHKGKRRKRLPSNQDIDVEYGDVKTAKKRVMVCCITSMHTFFLK